MTISRDMLLTMLNKAEYATCKTLRWVPSTEQEARVYEFEVRRYLLAKLDLPSDAMLHVDIYSRADQTWMTARIPEWGIGAEVVVGSYLRERPKLKATKTVGGITMVSAKRMGEPLEVKLIDGLTPDQCLSRYTLMQRDQAMVNSLTPMQLVCARSLWKHDVSVAVKKSERERREADRLQVVVDFEED